MPNDTTSKQYPKIKRGKSSDLSKNPALSGVRNRTAGRDIGKAPRSSHCAMYLSTRTLTHISDVTSAPDPQKKTHLYNIYTKLDQRRRRWGRRSINVIQKFSVCWGLPEHLANYISCWFERNQYSCNLS